MRIWFIYLWIIQFIKNKISIEFTDKISKIKKDIEEIKDKLNRYKGHRIDAAKEIEKLDAIYNELIQLENKDIAEEKYYQQYLIDVAKGYDVLKNEIATKVYNNSSQDILKSRIEYFLKCKKNFNHIINSIKNYFNF